MEYRSWTQMQQNPPLYPNSVTDPYAQNHYPIQDYYFPQPQNPNPNPNVDPHKIHEPHYSATLFQPPVAEPYPPVGSYTVIEDYTYQQTADGSSVVVSSAYYQDPNGVMAKEAVTVTQYGVNPFTSTVAMPPNGIEKLVPTNSGSNSGTYPNNHPQKRGKWKKVPKKTRVLQSAWCEICIIECNTKDVLDQHKLGKKHKKNLEKLKGAAHAPLSAPAPSLAPASSPSADLVASDNLVIGPQENPDNARNTSGQKVRKKSGEPPEDLETKRRKVLEGGAAADAVRTCAVCNVVCNSETVFTYHLAGQKHAAMMKKHASLTGLAAAI